MRFRVKLKFMGIIIPFLSVFLMSENIFAAQFNSWLNIQDISKTNLSNDWITHNTPNAGSYSVSGSTRLQTYQLSASANLSSSLTGPYFNATGSIYIDVPNDLDGGVVCSAFTNGFIVPENVSVSITSTGVTNCSYDSAPYVNKFTININTLGSISSGTPTSFYFSLASDPNEPFISLVGTPDNSPRVFISGDINFSSSSSPELNSLSEINQNIIVISGELQNMQEQMSQNTQSIINNQNQNTEAIIKSNQHCYAKNLLNTGTGYSAYGITATYNSNNGYFNVVGTPTSSWTSISINNFRNIPSGTYTFSTTQASSQFSKNIRVFYSNDSYLDITIPKNRLSVTANIPNDVVRYNLRLLDMTTGVSINDSFGLMLESGSAATEFSKPGEEYCVDIDQEYYDEQRQADQNISNQSSSDIEGAENQATTNLIGVLSNFFAQLQNFQATNCNLDLPFPQFIGGTQTVNICQGKDVLGNFITVIGTLAMVGFYIPLAWVLLKMIYNEIRSFTNG